MTPSEAGSPEAGSPPQEAGARRLGELLGFAVVNEGGAVLGHVNDVRLATGAAVRGTRAELLLDGLVVGNRHAGSLLGYDRRREQGPWLLRRVVRWLHRRAGYVPWRAVRAVDWSGRRVVVGMESMDVLTTSS